MDDQPFLSIVTRSYKKPNCLKRNIASVEMQTDQDLEQIHIVDDVGRGLAWADQALHHNMHRNNGKYVMVLDDDDLILNKHFITLLKHVAERKKPDVIIWRGKFLEANITLPLIDQYWGRYPIRAFIGSFNYCLRNELYQKHIHVCQCGISGDFDLIKAVFEDNPTPNIFWYNKILVSTQQKSYGKTTDCKGD